MVQLLLERGAVVDSRENFNWLRPVAPHSVRGPTPLHFAALNGRLECARLLLERGADKEAKDWVRAHPHCYGARRCLAAAASSTAAAL